MQIELRQTDDFERWLRSIRDRPTKARVLVRLRRLSLGHVGDMRALPGGISELRLHAGPGHRICLMWRGPALVVLLAGGDKGSQRRDIARALRLAHELEE